MKGAYVLYIRLARSRDITIGKLGRLHFRKGYYAYVGSALNGIESRVLRHLRKEKKMHWHIDYLLQNAEILEVLCLRSDRREECSIAEKFGKIFICVPGFGCGGCKCQSHLFYSPRLPDLRAGC